MNSPAEELETARKAILAKALDLVPFDGWTESVLRRAVEEAGFEPGMVSRAFPKGAGDLLHYWAVACDDAMAEHMASQDLDAMRIRDKITTAVRVRIEAMAPHKEAARKASQYFAHPLHAASAAAHIARTCDRIWRAINDQSADFNFFTKRLTLSGVYGSTFVVWLDDRSEGAAQTWAFLDRRIENVMQFEKFKAKARGRLEKLPDPLGLLAALRYPAPRRR